MLNKNYIFIVISLIFFLGTNAQTKPIKINDIFVFEGDSIFNNVDLMGTKQGKWIEYTFHFLILCSYGTGVDSLGNEVHTSSTTYIPDEDYNDFRCFKIGTYKNGIKVGTWRTFNNDIILIEELCFKSGKIIEFKTYYQNGKIRMEGIKHANKCKFHITKYNEIGQIIENKRYPKKRIRGLFK